MFLGDLSRPKPLIDSKSGLYTRYFAAHTFWKLEKVHKPLNFSPCIFFFCSLDLCAISETSRTIRKYQLTFSSVFSSLLHLLCYTSFIKARKTIVDPLI